MSEDGRRRPSESRHLYAIAGLWTRRVKIGRAAFVFSRLEQLQSASGEELCLLAWAADRGFREQCVHWSLREHHVHGEWFDADATTLIAAVVGGELLDLEPSLRFEHWVDGHRDSRGPLRSWKNFPDPAFMPSRFEQRQAGMRRVAAAMHLGQTPERLAPVVTVPFSTRRAPTEQRRAYTMDDFRRERRRRGTIK